MPISRKPVHLWFAWHPVWTEDQGWKWLTIVRRRRVHYDFGAYVSSEWVYASHSNN